MTQTPSRSINAWLDRLTDMGLLLDVVAWQTEAELDADGFSPRSFGVGSGYFGWDDGDGNGGGYGCTDGDGGTYLPWLDIYVCDRVMRRICGSHAVTFLEQVYQSESLVRRVLPPIRLTEIDYAAEGEEDPGRRD